MNEQPEVHVHDVVDRRDPRKVPPSSACGAPPCIALLTGGGDRPYVFGLTTELTKKGATLDLIGSNQLDLQEFRERPGINFLNLRGDQRPEASLHKKTFRVLRYYAKLIRYAVTANPKIFHILWHNKIDLFDRTVLLLYYKMLGKKLVFTAHNVNAGRRDGKDTLLNRLSLRIQYRIVDHVFVHTAKMKDELMKEFAVPERRITVIPFGINNAVPRTKLSTKDAKLRLGITDDRKNILFFGRITPYKGLEYLIAAYQEALANHDDFRLIIAGRPTDCDGYWRDIQSRIRNEVNDGRILLRADFIPDSETEVYFKAADVLILPYRHVYQSGVLFLAYSFGLPALAADVGSLKDDIVEGQTGFVFEPESSVALAGAIKRYFESDLFQTLNSRRKWIQDFAASRHSWDVVGQKTLQVYSSLLGRACQDGPVGRGESGIHLNVNVSS
jgi:D-inositol-3-phosphate glycosyltransferase